MMKRLHGWIAISSALTLCLVLLSFQTGCGKSAEGGTTRIAPTPAVVESTAQGQIETRVLMARPGEFEKLERAPVLFDHLKHVDALKQEGCKACHTADEKGNVTYQFCDLKGKTDRTSRIDAYHDKCLKCHDGKTKGAENARALGCGDCHVETAAYKTVEWYQATFDHFHHLDAMQQGCNTCHHVYDEQQHKLVYKKGQEIACGECHKETDEANTESLRKVGHTSCIGCHEKEYLAAKTKMDPYTCQGCHKPETKPVPPEPRTLVARSYQAHPTTLLISYPGALLPPVSFDHEKHEKQEQGKDETCSKSCHHFHVRTLAAFDPLFVKTGDACRQCHAQAKVSISADDISSDKLYHDEKSPYTCIGCHKTKMAEKKDFKGPVTCKGCHKETTPLTPVQMDTVVSPEKGPETYVIARLSKKFLPVKFPHAQHTKMIEDCNYCHHHGPEKETPTCNTCHGAPLDFTRLTRPRLISAYHRMCMGCHKNMGIGPVACTKCHEAKEALYVSEQWSQTKPTTNETGSPGVPESL